MIKGLEDLRVDASAHEAEDHGPLFRWLKSRINEDYEKLKLFRDNARRDFAAYSGEAGQWLKEELDALEGLRHPMTINRIQPLIDAAVGHEINSRSDITYKPRSIGRTAKNEVLTQGVEHFRDEADAFPEETAAMRSAYICGVGCVEHTMQYDEDPEGRLCVEDRDILQMGWDWRARRPNLTDASRVWLVKEMPLSEARTMFPDAEIGDLDARWWTGHPRPENSDGAYIDLIDDEHDSGVYDAPAGLSSSTSVTLIQVEWRRKEVRISLIDPDGGPDVEIEEGLFNTFRQRYFSAVGEDLPHVRRRKYVYYKTFVGRRVLGHNESPCQTGFSFKFMTGYRDADKGVYYGLTRNLLGPQTWLNRMLTQLLHIINTNAKGGVMVESGAVDDHGEFEDNWAASDSVTWLEDGAISGGKVQAKPGPNIPTVITELITVADSLIYKVSGLSPELLGMSEAKVSGVLEHQRRHSSMAVLAAFFDARRLYLKQVGELMLEFVQRQYISSRALVRISGPEGEVAVPLIYAEAEGARFDVMIDESPDSPTAKERNWAVISQLVATPGVQAMMTPTLWGRVIETSPLPAATVAAINEEIARASSAEAQAAARAEAELEKAIAERELRIREIKAEADAAYRYAQAQNLLAQIPGEMAMDQAEAARDKAYADIARARAQVGLDAEDRRQRRMLDAARMQQETAIRARSADRGDRVAALRALLQAA